MRVIAMAVAVLAAVLANVGESAPATAPATAPAEPVERVVQWHETYEQAEAEATKRKCLRVVVYFDPADPAWEPFEDMTLKRPATRRMLAEFAACRLNVKDPAKKKRFTKAGGRSTPLTHVLTPDGKPLDVMIGCIIPAGRFCERLQTSLDWYDAATAKPKDPAARWRAVQARLKLSTADGSLGDIDALLKTRLAKRPEGVTDARMRLARGLAQRSSAPDKARADFNKAVKQAGEDKYIAAEATLALADLDAALDNNQAAHTAYSKYLKQFPKGMDAGLAAVRKATLEFAAFDDVPGAKATLMKILRDHPDDARAAEAKALLENIEKLLKKPKPKPKKKPEPEPKTPSTQPAEKRVHI